MLVELGGNLFLQQLDAFAQRGEITDDQGELLGGGTQLPDILLFQPLRGAVQQTQQRTGLQRQQPLQPHQHTTHGAELRAVVAQTQREQLILDAIHAQAGFTDDLGEQVALVPQQVNEQFDR
ncbi:hypothetical protein FQZ97_940840 [compost metagenome]